MRDINRKENMLQEVLKKWWFWLLVIFFLSVFVGVFNSEEKSEEVTSEKASRMINKELSARKENSIDENMEGKISQVLEKGREGQEGAYIKKENFEFHYIKGCVLMANEYHIDEETAYKFCKCRYDNTKEKLGSEDRLIELSLDWFKTEVMSQELREAMTKVSEKCTHIIK